MKEDEPEEKTVSKSWIVRTFEQLGTTRGRLEVNHHVMEVYREYLENYFRSWRCASYLWLGDAGDVVAAFFANRLGRDSFFDKWQQHEMRLRRWLTNAFHFYLKEAVKSAVSPKRTVHLADYDPPARTTSQNDAVMDKTFAECVVREACRRTRAMLESEGRAAHWRVLMEHYWNDRTYSELAGEIGVSEAHVRTNMARLARERFRSVLRGIISRDGALESEVDDEIRHLQEALES